MSERSIHPDTKLVSFDLWLTLIRSNGKNFKNARNAYMGSLLAPHMPEDEFDTLVRKEDKASDALAETRGGDVLFAERVRRVAEAVGVSSVSQDLLEHLYDYQGHLFQKNLPRLLHPDTPQLLDKIKDRYGQLGIVSNTGYMHGDQMRPALHAIGIGEKFDHMVFSNEVGVAKPHPRIYQRLLDMAGVEPAQVTHIGDNLHADVAGATQMGMHAVHLAGDVNLQTLAEA